MTPMENRQIDPTTQPGTSGTLPAQQPAASDVTTHNACAGAMRSNGAHVGRIIPQEFPVAHSVPEIVLTLAVTSAEAAALLGIGRTTFLKLNSAGRVPMPIRFGRSVRWRRDELRAWLNAGCPNRDRWKWTAK
jgi:excisionase family DNA binding protein